MPDRRKAVPFEELGRLVRVLDKVATDGSSRGTLRVTGDLVEDGEGGWGFAGRAALSETLATALSTVPAELRGEIERAVGWTGRSTVELEWEFGPGGLVTFTKEPAAP